MRYTDGSRSGGSRDASTFVLKEQMSLYIRLDSGNHLTVDPRVATCVHYLCFMSLLYSRRRPQLGLIRSNNQYTMPTHLIRTCCLPPRSRHPTASCVYIQTICVWVVETYLLMAQPIRTTSVMLPHMTCRSRRSRDSCRLTTTTKTSSHS